MRYFVHSKGFFMADHRDIFFKEYKRACKNAPEVSVFNVPVPFKAPKEGTYYKIKGVSDGVYYDLNNQTVAGYSGEIKERVFDQRLMTEKRDKRGNIEYKKVAVPSTHTAVISHVVPHKPLNHKDTEIRFIDIVDESADIPMFVYLVDNEILFPEKRICLALSRKRQMHAYFAYEIRTPQLGTMNLLIAPYTGKSYTSTRVLCIKNNSLDFGEETKMLLNYWSAKNLIPGNFQEFETDSGNLVYKELEGQLDPAEFDGGLYLSVKDIAKLKASKVIVND